MLPGYSLLLTPDTEHLWVMTRFLNQPKAYKLRLSLGRASEAVSKQHAASANHKEWRRAASSRQPPFLQGLFKDLGTTQGALPSVSKLKDEGHAPRSVHACFHELLLHEAD